MDKIDYTSSPVIQELTTLLQEACPEVEDWEFKACVAKADTTGKRCKKSLGQTSSSKAKVLWRQFGLMMECPETDEFLEQVAGFLAVSHCSSHKKNAKASLGKWKGGRVMSVSLSSVQGFTIHDIRDNKGTVARTLHMASATRTTTSTLEVRTIDNDSGVSVHVVERKNTVSTNILAANSPGTADTPSKDAVATKEGAIGPNQESVQRNEAKKDDASSVLLEMQKPPTSEEAARGVVHVLEHELGNGLFKIGWTKDGMRDCNTTNSRVIYETPGGPFFAACKVKSLGQIALHPQNLGLTECHGCEEWLGAPVDTVLETVKTMETFVRLPAYESKDGQNWELSSAADDVTRNMGAFSLGRLKEMMNPTEQDSTGKAVASPATKPSQQTVTCVGETAAPPISHDTEEDSEGRGPLITPEPKGLREGFKSTGKSLSNSGKTLKKIFFGLIRTSR
ncbi:hypothetical protein LX36DRAFT_661311 [Colletotrichum falcatum]|nr:hypothetical protein LX36DRAFT_661311 [Colletotrichum falcatum]